MTTRDGQHVEATFCFVDISGFTALTEAHGGSAAADLIDRFRELVDVAREGQGHVVDRAGDAFFLVWREPAESVRFAARLLESARREPDFPRLRVGLHHGRAVERDGGYFGPDVNIAARVAADAHAEQVLATDAVAVAARTQGLPVTPMGPRQFKNVQSEIHVFAIEVGSPDADTSIDPVCKMRVSQGAAGGRLTFDGETYWFCSLDCARRFAEDPAAFTSSPVAEAVAKDRPLLFWLTGAVLAFLALGIALRLENIEHAEFEVDELQHLHGAYMVSRGAVPYRDFFEHHTPLFYLAGGSFIDPEQAGTHTIFRFRSASLLAHLGAVAIGVAMVGLGSGPAAIAVLVFLFAEIFSFAWGTLTFLDSFAAPLLLLSALIVSARPRAVTSYLATGLLIGTAILLTQKAVCAAPAPLALLLLSLQPGDSRTFVVVRAALLAIGGAVIPLALLLWQLGPDGFAAFWSSAVVLNSRWVARRWPTGEAFIVLAYGGSLWVLGFAGLAGVARQLYSGATIPAWALTPALYLGALLVGTIALPVVWYEYFVLIGPFAAIVAGIVATDLARVAGLIDGEPVLLRRNVWLPPLILGMLIVVTLLQLVLRLTNDHYSPTWSLYEFLGIAAFGGVLLFAAKRAWGSKRYRRVACAGLALLSLLPVADQLSWLRRSGNVEQRRAIEFVQQNVGPHEAVFDGYSGYGAFRPHAYEYWFLHDEMLLMLSEAERTTNVIDRLHDPSVRAVVRDIYMEELPEPVQLYLDEHFAPGRGQVWLRASPRQEAANDE